MTTWVRVRREPGGRGGFRVKPEAEPDQPGLKIHLLTTGGADDAVNCGVLTGSDQGSAGGQAQGALTEDSGSTPGCCSEREEAAGAEAMEGPGRAGRRHQVSQTSPSWQDPL